MFTPILTICSGGDEHTRNIAEEIALSLQEERLDTVLYDLESHPPLDAYGAVVLVVPFVGGTWDTGVRQLLARNRETLVTVPVAVFAISGTDGDEDTRQELIREMSRYRWLHPIAADVIQVRDALDAVVTRNGSRSGGAHVSGPEIDAARSWAHHVARLLSPTINRVG